MGSFFCHNPAAFQYISLSARINLIENNGQGAFMKQYRLLHNTIILMLAMLATKIIGAVYRIPLANILGGTGMGFYSAAYGLFSPIYAITAAGIPTAVTRLIAQSASLGKYGDAKRIKRTAIWIFSAVGIVGTGLMAILAKPFAEHVSASPQSFIPTLIIAPSVLLCCVGGVYRGYFEGLGNIRPTAAAQVIEVIARLVFGLSLAYFTVETGMAEFCRTGAVFGIIAETKGDAAAAILPFAAGAAVLGVTISEVVAFVFLFVRIKFFSDGITKAEIQTSPPPERYSVIAKKLFKEIIPIAIGTAVMNLVSFIDLITVSRGIGKAISDNPVFFLREFAFLLGKQTKLEDLPVFMYGSYTGLAVSLFMLVPALAGMLDKSALPAITAACAVGDKEAIRRNITLVFRGTILMGLPACLGTGALAKPIMALLYGSRTDEAAVILNAFYILSAGGIFLLLSGVLFSVFYAAGKNKAPVTLMLCGIAVKWTGNIILLKIPELNIAAVSLSTVLCYFTVFLGGIFYLKRSLGIKLDFPDIFLKPLFAAVCCATAALFCWKQVSVFMPRVVSLGISALVGAVFYLLLLIITGGIKAKNMRNRQK